jgi:hypothetical protein
VTSCMPSGRSTYTRVGVCDGRREHRAAQREPSPRARLKIGPGHQPMLDGRGGRRGEPVPVIAGRQVVARLHSFDRVPELPPLAPTAPATTALMLVNAWPPISALARATDPSVIMLSCAWTCAIATSSIRHDKTFPAPEPCHLLA